MPLEWRLPVRLSTAVKVQASLNSSQRAHISQQQSTCRHLSTAAQVQTSLNSSERADIMEAVLTFVGGEDWQEARLAAAVVWAVAPGAAARGSLVALGAVPALLSLLARSFQARPCSSLAPPNRALRQQREETY